MNKFCKGCSSDKPIEEFELRNDTKNYRPLCRVCRSLLKKEYYNKNKERILNNSKIYIQNNKEKIKKASRKKYLNNLDEIKQYSKKYREKNKEKILIDKNNYYKKNRERLLIKNSEYKKQNRQLYNKNFVNRYNNDPCFKLRDMASKTIRNQLKKNDSSKMNKSISVFLFYTIEQLKQYLESLFEPWMTWNNWGAYDPKTWNDGDSSTWTWQLDHIIPQSELPYDSMEHKNFKKCWSLDNLRPYSAKQNSLDGCNRFRHKKVA